MDFEMYSPLVREGGMRALHDIAPHTANEAVGVPKFWNELRNEYDTVEIIAKADQGCAGIDVIRR